MTGPIKPLAAGADQFESIQKFKQYCEKQLDYKKSAEGKPAGAQVPLDQVMVLDREKNDGNYEILYRDPADNFFCGAHISLNNHEMVVRAGVSDTKTLQGEGQLEMNDACTLSKELVGKGESKTKTCADGMVSPQLMKPSVLESPSIQFFADHCNYHLVQKMKSETGYLPVMPFSLERTQVLNADNVEPNYQLRYESLGQNFVCEANIDPQTHSMSIYTGDFDGDPLAGQNLHVEMTDACTLTKDLIGPGKVDPKCKDKTLEERNWEQRLEMVFAGYVNYLGGKWLWSKAVNRFPAAKSLPGAAFRTAGNALLAGWVYDKATGLFLSPDNPIRKYGYYGALTAGAFAPVLWKKMASTTIVEALGTRLAANTILANTLTKVPWAKLGNRFLAVMALNYGLKWVMGIDDYESWVNQRVTDEVYDEEVYELDGWDFLVVPLVVKGVRAGCRELAPDAMDWAVTMDNDGIKERILKEDADTSREIRKYMTESLPLLLSTPGNYNPIDPKSFREFNLSELERPVELSYQEKAMASSLGKVDPKVMQRFLHINEEQYFNFVKRYHLYQIQEGAKYLTAVDQTVNDWARRVFNRDGTLRSGKSDELIYQLGDPKVYSDPASSEIIMARRIQVMNAYLDGQKSFFGYDMSLVSLAAGVIDSDGKLIVNEAFVTGLTLYASEVFTGQQPEKIQRLEELSQQLRWRYLQAQGRDRELIGDALRVLRVDPDTVVHQEDSANLKGKMCYKQDPKRDELKKLFQKYSQYIK